METIRRTAVRPWLIAGGAVAAAIPAFALGIEAWPEIVVPAYFIMRGRVLYDTIVFPHTPLLILITALLGTLAGLSPLLFRAMVSVCMAAGGGGIVAGSRKPWLGLAAGVPGYLIWCGYAGGITLWPDPLMAPLALLAALALERFQETPEGRFLRTAGLALGLCIVTKQTSAWLFLAALAWLAIAARAHLPQLLRFAAWASAPYAVFAIAWGLIFRTTSHIYWTLLVPLSGHAAEIEVHAPGMLGRALLLFLIVPVFLVMTRRWRSPLLWLALGAFGMAWPRFDVLHLSAAVAILAVMTVRSAEALTLRNALAFAVAAFATLFALMETRWHVGRGVYFWEDTGSRFYAGQVRRHIPPGGAFLNYNTQYETLYAITGTTSPLSVYVPLRFWYYLNKRGLGERLCGELQSRHRAPVLFTWLDARTDDVRIARTCVYRILSRAPVIEQINPATSWRLLR